MTLLDWLRLPGATNLDLDDPASSVLAQKIIQRKQFLKNLYREFYQEFARALPPPCPERKVVELGSGGGFIKDVIPDAITSDVLDLPGLDLCFSASEMPFPDGSVDAFVMIDVFHHLPDTERFFQEVDRCLKIDGKVLMVEPANTWWGRFVYTRFHHESFDPTAAWGVLSGGPLSSANGALPWIVFCRDRRVLEQKFPRLKAVRVEPHTPFCYLLSGGLSFRQLAPSWSYPALRAIERFLGPLNGSLGLFYTIEVVKHP